MNSTLRSILIVSVLFVIGGALFLGGVVFAYFNWGMRGFSMMGSGYGTGMMGGGYRTGMMGSGNGMGMMGSGYGMGMMGGSSLSGVKPISVDEAKKAVSGYLSGLGNDDLKLDEVIIFDNQAYARVIEKSTGIGAFEVLVDPVTLAVSPEPGPNMMWNQKYGMMSGNGMMGGRLGNGYRGMMGGATIPDITANMPVSPEEALQTAQKYLDTSQPGAKTGDKADSFYGYYTIEFQRDGKTAGMLSVNGYNGQVFMHTWHGKFVEISEA
jgi:hypothetical protein